jgi:starch synthase
MLEAICSYVATPWRALARELRQEGCDAIVCHEYDYPRFDLAVWVGALLRIPVFATFQGAKGMLSPIEVPLRRLAIRRAAGLVIAAGAERQRVLDRYRLRPGMIASTPNPFDTRRWEPGNKTAAREELGIPNDVVVVEWQGRVQMTRKGLDVLLDAWARVCDDVDEPVLLVLVGTGRDDDPLRRAIRAHRYADSICWIDHYVRDRAMLWNYLCAADIAVLPSRHEGFAVAAVEAMACGLPVVASDAPGVADALGSRDSRAGIIVPVEDPNALASGLKQLISDPALRADLGRRGRRRADERFSMETVGTELRRFMTARGAFTPDRRDRRDRR